MIRILMVLAAALVVAVPAQADRTRVTPTDAPGLYFTAGETVTETAADVSNSNSVTMTGHGRDLLLVRNSGGSTRTVTISSVADSRGRTGDIVETLAAGELKIYGPPALEGWRQTDRQLYFAGSHSDLKFSVIRLGR